MKFFDYNNGFMHAASTLSRITLLNVIWMVCCVPILTVGASTAAMYYSAYQLRQGDIHVYSNFKKGMALHWKRASLAWVLQAVLTAAFVTLYVIVYNSDMPFGSILVSIAGLAFLTMVFITLWLYPIMVQFSGNFREILFNAFVFAFMYAPLTLAVAVIIGASGYLAARYILARGLVVFFGPALCVYMSLALFDKAFQKYKTS